MNNRVTKFRPVAGLMPVNYTIFPLDQKRQLFRTTVPEDINKLHRHMISWFKTIIIQNSAQFMDLTLIIHNILYTVSLNIQYLENQRDT